MKEISDAFGRRIKKSGITRIQWIALYYINTNEYMTQRQLSKLMHVKDSSVGRLLDRLERDQMIQRVRSKEDRRSVNILLTEEGKAKIKDLTPEGDKFNNKLIEGLTEEELRIFEKVMSTMVRNIKDYK